MVLLIAVVASHRTDALKPAAGVGDAQVAMLDAPARPEAAALPPHAPVWKDKVAPAWDAADMDKAVPEKAAMDDRAGALGAAKLPALAKPDAAKGANVQAPMAMPAPGFAPAGAGGMARAAGPEAKRTGGGEGAFGAVTNLQGGARGQGLQEREKQFGLLGANELQQNQKDVEALKKADRFADGVIREEGPDKAKEAKDAAALAPDAFRRAVVWQDNLRRLRQLREQAGDGKRDLDLATATQMVVREYAHDRGGESLAELRTDFAETLYWHPVLVLPDGKADVSFDLCDSATTFQATVYAHTTGRPPRRRRQAAGVAAAVRAATGDAHRGDGLGQDRRAVERGQQHARPPRRASDAADA